MEMEGLQPSWENCPLHQINPDLLKRMASVEVVPRDLSLPKSLSFQDWVDYVLKRKEGRNI